MSSLPRRFRFRRRRTKTRSLSRRTLPDQPPHGKIGSGPSTTPNATLLQFKVFESVFGGWMNFSSSGTPVAADSLRRAKIVATLGPASSSETIFRELLRAGLDVARLNFSHGTLPEKLKLIEMVRKVSREEGKPICILGDLQGPKIRTGRLKNRIPVQLKAGQRLTITPRDILGSSTVVSTTFPTLAENLEPGARILFADGLI